MAKTDYQSVDEYVRQLSEPGRSVLRRVIALIAKAVPRAEPVISYQIAAFKLDGRALVYLAAWKEHYSVYPATPGVIAAFENELRSHRGGRGTLRFSFDEPIPSRLLAGIAKVRAAEVAELEALKAARKAAKRAPKRAAAKRAPEKAAANPAAKRALKKAAANPAAKRTLKKAAANPAAKRAPEKAAANPAAKRALKKAAANPAAKSSPKKTAVKPVRSKATSSSTKR